MPFASFPVVVTVIAFPSAESVRVVSPVSLPAFHCVLFTVCASTCFNVNESYSGEPVNGYDLPSYLKVDFCVALDPSAVTVAIVSDVPSADCVYVRV